MRSSAFKALAVALPASLLLSLAVFSTEKMAGSGWAAGGAASLGGASLFVQDEDLDVKIFVHQNRPL